MLIPLPPELFWFPVTVSQLQNSYAIYTHKSADDIVRYVGVCKFNELYSFPDALQNSEWRNVFKPEHTIIIEPVAMTENEAEAYREQKRLCDIHQPFCNMKGYNMVQRYQRVRCIETGELFSNATNAAKAHNLTPSALHNHLKRLPGHKTVKGKTYEYTTERY